MAAAILGAALGSASGALAFQQAAPTPPKTTGQTTGQGAPPAAGAPVAQPPRPTPDELSGLSAIQNELDPDRSIQLADDFVKKYPESLLLGWIYFFQGNSYQQKNQIDKMQECHKKAVENFRKSLGLDGDNLSNLMIAASLMPQPSYLPQGDMDKSKQLSDAEGYATHALGLLDTLQKTPNETDDQFKVQKDDYQRKMHGSLAMNHLERASMGLGGMDPQELGKSEAEYKLAVDGADKPNPEYVFRLAEVYMHEKKVDEAIDTFTKAETLEPAYKPFADPNIEQLKKLKGPTKPAGTP